MFILMIVLLVATTLLGIFASEYLYEQYKYFFGDEVILKSILFINNSK